MMRSAAALLNFVTKDSGRGFQADMIPPTLKPNHAAKLIDTAHIGILFVAGTTGDYT